MQRWWRTGSFLRPSHCTEWWGWDEMKTEWAAVAVASFPGWEAAVAAENKVSTGRVRVGVETNTYWQWSHKKTNVYLNWVPVVAQISYSVSAVFFKFSQPHLSFCIMLYYFPALCQLKSLVFMPAACQALINIRSAAFSVVFVYSVAGNLLTWENIFTEGRDTELGVRNLKSRMQSAYCSHLDVNANIIHASTMLAGYSTRSSLPHISILTSLSEHHSTFHSCGQRNWARREGHYWHPAAKGGRLASLTNCPLIILTLSGSSW